MSRDELFHFLVCFLLLAKNREAFGLVSIGLLFQTRGHWNVPKGRWETFLFGFLSVSYKHNVYYCFHYAILVDVCLKKSLSVAGDLIFNTTIQS